MIIDSDAAQDFSYTANLPNSLFAMRDVQTESQIESV